MNNNLTSNNLSPFVSEKTLKKLKVKQKDGPNIEKDFNFKDFISNETNPLPLIPGIYFNSNEDNIKKDNIGSKIINNYYTIKICMKKLLLIKTFILSILKVSGVNDIDKINISKEKYKLLKSDLIIPFNDTLSGTFKDQDYFKKFIKLYKDQKYGIFKNFNLEIPYFFQIFQIEYNNTPKTFFISLFNKYITLRRKILTYITENFGLLAFTSFFDLSDNIDFGMLKNDIRNKNSNNNDEFNENYKNYILYGNNINILSNESKVNKKKITEKIHSFDYLYNSKFDNAYYKRKHQEIIHKNYFNLKESINNFIGSNASFDLLSIIENNLEVDYNTINFIFNYVDPLIYGKAVDSNILIKQFISKKINNFELYYDQYMYWIKTLCKNIEGDNSKIDDDYNFKNFYDNILKEIEKSYSDPCKQDSKSNDGSSGVSSGKDNFVESYIISLELEMIEKLNKTGNYSNNKVNELINNEKTKNKLNEKYNKKLKNMLDKISNNLKKFIIMTPEDKEKYKETLEQKIKTNSFHINNYTENINNFDESYIISLELEMIEKLNKTGNYSNNKVNELINNEKTNNKLNEKYNKKLTNMLDKISNNLKKFIIMSSEDKEKYKERLEQKFKKNSFNRNNYTKNTSINISRVNNQVSPFNSIL
jgi:hypothetical protein